MNGCIEAVGDDAHFAACPTCRRTAATLALLRQSTLSGPDLWPRLRARLLDRDDVVRLRVPPVGWQAVVALAAIAAIIMLAPEPDRLLAVMAGML